MAGRQSSASMSVPEATAMADNRYELAETYERLRKTLREMPSHDHLDRPISHWVLPSDRRVPRAFLELPIDDLLARPLESLMATPGVGEKKIRGLFDLLRRVSRSDSSVAQPAANSPNATGAEEHPNPSSVNEDMWTAWCRTVGRCGLREVPLGRVAPTLLALPSTLWRTPLEAYCTQTLAQFRSRKGYGAKRVEAILDVFASVTTAVATCSSRGNLRVDLSPAFVRPVTQWLLQFDADDPPSAREAGERLVDPLVEQLSCDVGATAALIVAERLMDPDAVPTLSEQASAHGLGRPRLYQLLDKCELAMAVRWPEGRPLLLGTLHEARRSPSPAARVLQACADLLFSRSRTGQEA